ncbi:C40 family peptidase [Cohnella rhizosphaerae]|uniref:C40 family peptidase n=2 Tax=Cohnella rhizosphaerae TaxID=1457232 RepID=A0A9X4KV31_9BACL|nr:C40 family peptidase [Cohnella rhizosphaerae]
MSYRGASSSAYGDAAKSHAAITHVAIYLGDGKLLQTYSKDSGGVRIDTIEGTTWEKRFLFGGSAL